MSSSVGYSPYHYTYLNPIKYNDPTGQNGELTINKKDRTATISMDFYVHGDAIPRNFDAAAFAQGIQDAYNEANGTMTVDGVEYSVTFSISASIVTDKQATEKLAQSDVLEANGNMSYARINTIDISQGNTAEITSDRSMTISPKDLGTTTPTHEGGHLLGLVHDGGLQRSSVVDPPSIMSTIYNSVSGQYSVDGRGTAWTRDDNGVMRAVQGQLDNSTRRVLPRNISAMGHRNNIKMRGNRGVVGYRYRTLGQ